MKNKKIIAVLILLIVLFSSSVQFAQATTSDDIENFFDNTMQYYLENDMMVGSVVTVVKDDEMILNKGYGYADKERKIVSDGSTVAYEIGSIAKTFVGLSAMQLVEEGKLKLDQPISTYLNSDAFQFKYPVTMHDLLTHTAGFEDQLSGLGLETLEGYKDLNYYLTHDQPHQVFKPGEVTAYSNYGIGLAAHVIEIILKKPYYQVVEERILEPLQMDRSTFQPGEMKAVTLAKGYKPDGTPGIEQYVSLYPSGGASATGEDMGRYMQFLLTEENTLLSHELKKELFKKQFTMVPSLEGIGYTWNRDRHNNQVYYRKKGERQFTQSKLLIYPSEAIGVFISINSAFSTHDFDNLTRTINDFILGESDPTIVNRRNSHDISGCYVSTKSSFSREKFLNIIIPNKIISIDQMEGDFFLQNDELKMLENNTFLVNDKLLKYIEKDNESYLIANGAESYIKLPWYEGKGWQRLTLVFFLIMSLIMLMTSFKNILSTNGQPRDKIIYANLKYVPGILMVVITTIMIISIVLLINKNVSCLVTILMFLSHLILINTIVYGLLINKINHEKSNFLKGLNWVFLLSSINMVFWLYHMNLIL